MHAPARVHRGRRAPWIAGISASHNGAVCLLKGDEIVAAIQEERLTRIKRDHIYGAAPSRAFEYCLTAAGIAAADLDLVVLSAVDRLDDPQHDVSHNPQLQQPYARGRVVTMPHHLGHAISAFATSGFNESAVLVIDGRGSPLVDFTAAERALASGHDEDDTEIISLYAASGTTLTPLQKHLVDGGRWLVTGDEGMPAFGSLGGMFSAAAQQIFSDSREAGKVMGLAPYGRPSWRTCDFFAIADGRITFSDRVPSLFTHNDRWPQHQETYADLACSVQSALEDGVLSLARTLRARCPGRRMCYAGGVALNSVANERLIRESGFSDIHIVPAAEDSGVAIGAAYYGLWMLTGRNTTSRMTCDACGTRYDAAAVRAAIDAARQVSSLECPDTIAPAVDLLCEGKIIGWFDGRSELGPRALGQRSILCDPRRADGKDVVNRRVKRRESFRPFAPAILAEHVRDWFDVDGVDQASPFMLRVCSVNPQKRALVPAVIHVDNTGRVQTLTRDGNCRFHDLVQAFYERTGVPMLLNTSFNVKGEPIVETPADAIACLLNTGLDACVFEDRIVVKTSDR